MSTLNDAIKQFEAVEANVAKLDRLWKEIDAMLPTDERNLSIGDPIRYRQLARSFQHIQSGLPKIDGFALQYKIWDPDDVISAGIDVLELGEISAGITFIGSIHEQADALAEYRFRTSQKRRELARQAIIDLQQSIETRLRAMCADTEGCEPHTRLPQEHLEPLRDDVKAIETLLGSTLPRPSRWSALLRHIHFGQKADLDDIVRFDWPAVKDGLESVLYGEEDPVPVTVEDLGTLVASRPVGPVTTALKWERLTPNDLERLLFNLVDHLPTYENPTWLSHTNAPDRGRDLEVHRVQNDALIGIRRTRMVIACKHTQSVGLPVISTLVAQMSLWDPRVDELVIATTGTFTTDAIQFVEKHNSSNNALHIALWPSSHLERLLAQRPELIAEFHLRK